MALKYKTNIEITSEAKDKNEAMEIVGDYLSGNIASGIEMKCVTKPVHFYNSTATKAALIILLVTVGFLSGARTQSGENFSVNTCRMDAVTPPLKTSNAGSKDLYFKKEWQEKQAKEVLDYIKK